MEIPPAALAVGSSELIEEVSTGKITGEEDRYSHTDLWDFAANVEGAEKGFELLEPAIEEEDPELAADIEDQFDELDAQLAEYEDGERLQVVRRADRRGQDGHADDVGRAFREPRYGCRRPWAGVAAQRAGSPTWVVRAASRVASSSPAAWPARPRWPRGAVACSDEGGPQGAAAPVGGAGTGRGEHGYLDFYGAAPDRHHPPGQRAGDAGRLHGHGRGRHRAGRRCSRPSRPRSSTSCRAGRTKTAIPAYPAAVHRHAWATRPRPPTCRWWCRWARSLFDDRYGLADRKPKALEQDAVPRQRPARPRAQPRRPAADDHQRPRGRQPLRPAPAHAGHPRHARPALDARRLQPPHRGPSRARPATATSWASSTARPTSTTTPIG